MHMILSSGTDRASALGTRTVQWIWTIEKHPHDDSIRLRHLQGANDLLIRQGVHLDVERLVGLVDELQDDGLDLPIGVDADFGGLSESEAAGKDRGKTEAGNDSEGRAAHGTSGAFC